MREYIPKDAVLIPEQAQKMFKGIIFDVYQWQQELYDGSHATFEMLKRPDTVRAICVKEGKIVVLEQEQPGVGMFYDFPSGRHDVENENELDAAKRETLEETGMSFANWRLLDVMQPHVKIDWFVYTFLATELTSEVAQELDGGERVTVTLKTFEELKELIKDPKARYLAKDVLENVNSLDELLALPDCRSQS